MFAIYFGGSYLANKKGWGPTFTVFRDDARTFRSQGAALDYIARNLEGMGCCVVHL